ncbi:hypothetical protein HAX54_034115 [Datura stramonium]|uniref:Uncharacterized protein n=1 Tax=Datura stramonium TaxID=4076 RepID=A0ABS8VH63_DATST|nr:hypothetical protein [Datura stramonium]
MKVQRGARREENEGWRMTAKQFWWSDLLLVVGGCYERCEAAKGKGEEEERVQRLVEGEGREIGVLRLWVSPDDGVDGTLPETKGRWERGVLRRLGGMREEK